MRFQPWPLELPKDALRRLIGEVIPQRLISRAATVGPTGALDAPGPMRRRNGVNYLHDLANGSIAKPSAEGTWWAGMAASAVTRARWCNPTLFLFAAGHYVEFATVLLRADGRITSHRKRDLVLNVASTIIPTPPPPDREELIRRNLDLGHDELSARRAAAWEIEMEPKPRVDRAIWSISGSEAETLQTAWTTFGQTAPEISHQAVAACYLAANGRVGKDGPDLPLAVRARIAVDAVAASLQ